MNAITKPKEWCRQVVGPQFDFLLWVLEIGLALCLMQCATVGLEPRSSRTSSVKPVFVVGNVRTPSSFILRDDVTLAQAIAIAGGVRKSSKMVRARIIRGLSKQQDPIILELRAIMADRIQHLLLQPGDIVEISDERGQFALPDPFRFKLTTPIWDLPLRPGESLNC